MGKHRLVIGAELDAFDEDTGQLATFELRTPLVAHTTEGFGSLAPATPSRRVAVVAAPELLAEHRAVRDPIDWPLLFVRLAKFVVSVVTAVGVWLLFDADSADGQRIASAVISGGWISLSALAGWSINRG